MNWILLLVFLPLASMSADQSAMDIDAFPNSSFIPNKVYAGKKKGQSLGDKRLCQGKSSFVNEWSTVFRDVQVNIPDNSRRGARRFDIDFVLGDIMFKGRSSEKGAWTCEQRNYSANLSADELRFGVRILPTSQARGNARFELKHLSIHQLEVRELKAQRLGLEFGIEKSTPVWNQGLQRGFNAYCKWVLGSGISKVLNDLISKEVARIVENVFGSKVEQQRIQTPAEMLKREAEQLDKQLMLD